MVPAIVFCLTRGRVVLGFLGGFLRTLEPNFVRVGACGVVSFASVSCPEVLGGRPEEGRWAVRLEWMSMRVGGAIR